MTRIASPFDALTPTTNVAENDYLLTGPPDWCPAIAVTHILGPLGSLTGGIGHHATYAI